MEVVALLRLLWRYRVAVVIGCVVAVALGFMSTRGTTSRFGVASMRVLLDTPRSQTVDVTPVDPSLLDWRTGVAADLMATTPARQRIAREMGIGADEVAVSAPYLAIPIVPTPLPEAARNIGAASQRYQIAVQAVKALPIIEIDARAPTRAAAARLATVASDVLKAEFAVEAAPHTETLVIEDVGPARAAEVVDRPRRLTALVIVALVLGLWCAGITLFAGLRRAWSRAGRSSSSFKSSGDLRDGYLTATPRRPT